LLEKSTLSSQSRSRCLVNVGDLVRWKGTNSTGIVLNTYHGTASYTKVYWLDLMIFGSYPACDLEVVSESR
jgi:hypothetical protein